MNGLFPFIAGLAVLVGGAELVVRGASRLAASLGVKPLVLGLTVVAIGTSMPELAVGVIAARQGSGGLAVGNIAGTNVFNILFILGLSALVQPLPLQTRILRFDLPVMVVAATMMTVLAWDGTLTRVEGGVLFCAAILYTVALLHISRGDPPAVKAEFADMFGDGGEAPRSGWVWIQHSAVLAGGILLTLVGARFLVNGAVDMARGLGVSETMIGLTIVAVGTSAPELATTVVATLRGDRDVAVGNVVGSSVYNIFVILGLTCVLSPEGLPVERQLLLVDIPLMAGVAFLCIPVFVTGKRISRREGGLFVALYLAYMVSLIYFRD